MPLLSREQILQVDDRSTQDIAVPEWGGQVRIRTISGIERDAFENAMLGQPDADGNRQVTLENVRARLVAACAVDELGQRLFTPDDVEALGRKSGAALDRVYSACQKLNKMTREDVQELVGNSAAAQSGSSTSA